MLLMNHLIICLLGVSAITPLTAEPLAVASPDGRLKLILEEDADHHLSYTFQANGRPLINRSQLGFVTKDPAAPNLQVGTSRRSIDTVWKPVWGKRAVV